jgi:hypothetical protein
MYVYQYISGTETISILNTQMERKILEERTLYIHCCENHKSYTKLKMCLHHPEE